MTEKIITIEKIGGQGVGIGRIGGKVVFVPYSAPGDTIRIEILREAKSYYNGRITGIIEPSQARTEPVCPVFGLCGGCSFQHIVYDKQCEYKQNLVTEIFRHHIKSGTVIESIVPSPIEYGYRNKIQFKCKTRDKEPITFGFFERKTHSFVKTDTCFLANDDMNSLARSVVGIWNGLSGRSTGENYGPGSNHSDNRYSEDPHNEALRSRDRYANDPFIRTSLYEMIIHRDDEGNKLMLTLVANAGASREREAIVGQICSGNSGLTGLFLIQAAEKIGNDLYSDDFFDERPIRGKPEVIFGSSFTRTLAKNRFEISPTSFFQVNSRITEKVIEKIRDILSSIDVGESILVDLFAGVGTLSIPFAHLFKEVIAIDSDEQACSLAKDNARSNGIENYYVLSGDAGKTLRKLAGKITQAKMPVIIIDPPRSGLERDLINTISSLSFSKIIYMSCNPDTQVRDIETLTSSNRFRLIRVLPFDMFPQTHHIETLAILEPNRNVGTDYL
jgi:23S rRNA (uracil1939-C5)-methyltransferase